MIPPICSYRTAFRPSMSAYRWVRLHPTVATSMLLVIQCDCRVEWKWCHDHDWQTYIVLVWHLSMMSVCILWVHPLHCYTNKLGSDLGNSGVTVKLKWCHDVMIEAVDHLWLLLTSILDIKIVLWHLSMMLVCILWVHPLHCYTTKARSDFWQFWVTVQWKWCHGSWPWCHGWGCKPHLVAFWYILVRRIYSVMAPFNDVSVHIMIAPLHCYTNKPGSEFGNSGVTVELKWCHNVMVEAEDHLWLLLTSILDTYILFLHLSMMSVGIWVHPYTVTPTQLGWYWHFCWVKL